VKVAVLSGGRSSEHDVSVKSGASVAVGLREAGHEVAEVALKRDGTWVHDGAELDLRPGRGLLDCDVAFPVLHGPFGEDGTVQGLLELLDIAYAGSGVLASAVCLDKVVFKELMAQRGLAQVDYALVQEGDDPPDVGYPCWVKPARLGSSVGIVRVASADEMPAALKAAFGHDPRVIVEGHSAGMEVEASVLGHTDSPEVSKPGEIELLKGAGWYDFEAKYAADGMRLQIPARISDKAKTRVKELAAASFTVVGCSGMARADFFVEGDDVLLNEINTLPGFTNTSVYGALWDASGIKYPDLVDRICTIAVERHALEQSFRF
jgi:D-alanine-D-alanine ligase